MKDICIKCDHGMLEHGCDEGIGWCGSGNGNWCDCTEKGQTYEEALESLKE
tara:strand:- start:374 stop:526 length:153 start_codon:yes stop_codon:yes gene_type:complete